MARTTAAEVMEIMPDTSLTTAQINPFITVATGIVTEHLADCGMSDAELEEVERWLTAHIIAITVERQAKTEKVGEASLTYQGNFGEGLKRSTYGEMVMMLDNCGILAQIGKRKIKVHAIKSFS